MKFALAFALTLAPRSEWTGRDKVKHFLAAAVVQSVAYAALRDDDTRRRTALWGASAVTGAVSLGKEVWDKQRGRSFSVPDLVFDAAGAGTASLAIIHWSRK